MTASTIILKALKDGVTLHVTDKGTVKANGSEEAVTRWLPVLREHKGALLAALRPDPAFEVVRQAILKMADHWKYTPEDMEFALSDSAADPSPWLPILMAEGWLPAADDADDTRTDCRDCRLYVSDSRPCRGGHAPTPKTLRRRCDEFKEAQP